MSERPLRVLVLGAGGNVSQGILKSLAISRLRVEVIAACVTVRAAGLFAADEALISPLAAAPEFDDWLLATCEEHRIDAVLSGVEPVLERMGHLSTALRERADTVAIVSRRSTLEVGTDKVRTARWLEEQGLNYPETVDGTNRSAVSALTERVGFPLVCKPRTGKGSEGVVIVDGPSQLEVAMRNDGVIVQQHLGDGESEYTVGCFSDRDGVVRGALALRRGLGAGTTIWAEAGEYPQVVAEATRIATALKPMGPCNVQLRLHEGQPTAFEINVRFSGTGPIRARLGFNDVEAALRHYVLDEDPAPLPHITKGVALRYWNEVYPAAETIEELERTGRAELAAGDALYESWGTIQ